LEEIMGARAQLKIISKEFNAPLWFYVHNGSATLHTTLAEGLDAARGRWGDPEYFAAILFRRMVANYSTLDGTLGVGIAAGEGQEHTDLDYPAVVVDLDDEIVQWDTDRAMEIRSFAEFAVEPVEFTLRGDR
jgi:hypothetical protein